MSTATNTSAAISDDRLASIPSHLRIRVVYQDQDIVVVEKPCHLLSVPGLARNNNSNNNHHNNNRDDGITIQTKNSRKRSRSEPDGAENSGRSSSSINKPRGQLTAAEAWKKAIESLAKGNKSDGDDEPTRNTTTNLEQEQAGDDGTVDVTVADCIAQLGSTPKYLASVPRKFKTFQRYMEKNQKRIFPSSETKASSVVNSNELIQRVFRRIQQRQRHLMNLPPATSYAESAYGQLLVLLGYAETLDERKQQQSTNSDSHQRLYTVHRLDCETSGLLVFGRNAQAASLLSRAWRERTNVSKVYVARVYANDDDNLGREATSTSTNEKDDDPANPDESVSASSWGRIDLPLAPVDKKKSIRWKVAETDAAGKPSTTLWRRLHKDDPNAKRCRASDEKQQDDTEPVSSSSAMLLELKPITGRTHQLRVHCASMFGGIVGDSLYGKDRQEHISTAASAGSATITRQPLANERLYLHAWKLSFPHPSTQQPMEFVCNPKWLEKRI